MQLGVEFVDLTAVSIPVELASYVPKNIAKKFCVVPVKLVKDTLYLAMSDPLDFVAQAEVKVASRKRVIPMIATRRTTEHAISLLYGSEGMAGVIEEMKREAGSSTPDIVPVQVSQEAMDSGDSAPTIRFVSSLIERAVSERASDIHLEPQDGEMVVRMRIDGLLRRVLTVPSELQSIVISRLKIMGAMNIADHIAASLTLRGWSPPTICVELTKTDEGYTLKKSEHCCAVWKKKRRCENCISQEVLRTHKPQTKIETRESDIYYVLASFIEVDGRPYSLELVKRIKSDDMFDRENVLNQLLVRNRQVYTDSLTKVFNRRYCDERLRRLSGEYALAMIDIDNLKQINDCLGHPAGDTAIYHTAQAIRAILRSQDELVRYGGDEFLLLFHSLPQNILRRKLEDICQAVRALRVADLPELRITVSIGGVYAAGQISELVEKADLALYRAKAQKDSAVLYEEDFHDSE